MNRRLISLVLITIVFIFMMGCTSTADPIIGSWYKDTDQGSIYEIYSADHTYIQWGTDSSLIVTGTWKNVGNDWYSLALYSTDPLEKKYLGTMDIIYDKTRDAIYLKGYPEGRWNRAQSVPPVSTLPTLTPSTYIIGDIVYENNTYTDSAWLIVKYEPKSNRYYWVNIHRKSDGDWGCVSGGLSSNTYPGDRDIIEKYYPVKIGHISLDVVQDCQKNQAAER
jgi:hypothetical protein